MLLREHLLFNHRGVPGWPPAWTWVAGLDNKHPRGEIGTLRDVHRSNIQPADKCFIYIDFEEHPISDAFLSTTSPFADK